ncbi:MAG: hypothetical protein M1812_007853 [Candelaria pacifica]|nr:MAG: hypothetical protein M1812_007853 [Candelaria pacifica]
MEAPESLTSQRALVEPQDEMGRVESFPQASNDSQTASEFINSQLQLEADAREALPYAFDTCTQPLGPLRQNLFSCLTCNPPPASSSDPYTPAGVCYSCSISCHGEHELVELFNKRNFVCDCGTTRLPSTSPCSLRINHATGRKGGAHSEDPAKDNKYNHNFRNRFCGCRRVYDAHKEKGTMYQCLGLGTAEDGGCGEDWWHPSCIVGLSPDWSENCKKLSGQGAGDAEVATEGGATTAEDHNIDEDADGEDPPSPPGFPHEDDFDQFICWKCVDANPWIKRYAGTPGFLPPVFKRDPSVIPDAKDIKFTNASKTPAPSDQSSPTATQQSSKRKASSEDDNDDEAPPSLKRPKPTPPLSAQTSNTNPISPSAHHDSLPPSPTSSLSLFLHADFRQNLCHCPECFPNLSSHPHLLEEEESYEPPLSESGDENGTRSAGTGSLLERGEAALSNVDRVRAIEGVTLYNDLKQKVKLFLQPFAESGQAVGAEDIKAYFEKLRGDAEAIKAAGASASFDNGKGGEEDHRREQGGY